VLHICLRNKTYFLEEVEWAGLEEDWTGGKVWVQKVSPCTKGGAQWACNLPHDTSPHFKRRHADILHDKDKRKPDKMKMTMLSA
jgi:hypothetical protein